MIDLLRQPMLALEVLMKAQKVTANNLANINTPGYKSANLFYRAFRDEVNGTEIASVEPYQMINMQQGTLSKTGNPFDFAIQGEGFFVLQKNGHQLLKRSGHFKLNPNGFLVDGKGARVMGVSGFIHLPMLVNSSSTHLDVDVAKDGTISINGNSYGRLKLVQVKNIREIERLGSSYYSAPENMITQSNGEKGEIMQGYMESSNVNPLTGMVKMTTNMRLFQSQQRAMHSMNEMLSQVTSKLGKY